MSGDEGGVFTPTEDEEREEFDKQGDAGELDERRYKGLSAVSIRVVVTMVSPASSSLPILE